MPKQEPAYNQKTAEAVAAYARKLPALKAVKPKSEADSASSFPAAIVAAVKKLPAKEAAVRRTPFSTRFRTPLRVREAASAGGKSGSKFRVVLIEEGMGNLTDCFYYTRASLESAVELFEGKKSYIDHPDLMEEQIQPERSVADILGHFEDLRIEESEGGSALLCADFALVDGAAFDQYRAVLLHALEYSKKYTDQDFIGFSINAQGESEELPIDEFIKATDLPESAVPKVQKALQEGVDLIRRVDSFVSATSCDLVTEAGAGGRVETLLEQERKRAMTVKTEKQQKEAQAAAAAAALAAKTKKKPVTPAKESAEGGGAAAPAEHEAEGKDGDGGSGHDDADQDKALIQSMLKKHDSGEMDEADEAHKAAHEAYEAAKACGHEGDAAVEAASGFMKMARQIASKKEAGSKGDEQEAVESQESAGNVTVGQGGVSMEAQVLKMAGEIASLREDARKREVKDAIEAKLSKSKLSRATTNLCRETLGSPKTVKEAESKIDLFIKAFKAGGGSEAGDAEFVIEAERGAGEGSSSGPDFADCASEE